MSLLSRLTGFFRAGKQPGKSDLLHADGEDEFGLLRRLLSDPALAETLKELQIDGQRLLDAIASRMPQDTRESQQALASVFATVQEIEANPVDLQWANRPQQVHLFASLLVHGSAEVQSVFRACGLDRGSMAFRLAHGQDEQTLRSTWTPVACAQAKVQVLNDPYSPMQVVHECLSDALEITQEQAIELMLKVHWKSSASVDTPGQTLAAQFCDYVNPVWRRKGLPLYVRPFERHEAR